MYQGHLTNLVTREIRNFYYDIINSQKHLKNIHIYVNTYIIYRRNQENDRFYYNMIEDEVESATR